MNISSSLKPKKNQSKYTINDAHQSGTVYYQRFERIVAKIVTLHDTYIQLER